MPSESPAAADIVAFWREAGPKRWFKKDPAFDAAFRTRFLALHDAAALGELDGWRASPEGALALVILLDQFPRNAFRYTPRMFATDALAREVADQAIAAGHDRAVGDLAAFFYMPFVHSENLADQERAVALCGRVGGDTLRHAQAHRDVVARFGRFPHRNAVVGREPTEEEERFLEGGGYRA